MAEQFPESSESFESALDHSLQAFLDGTSLVCCNNCDTDFMAEVTRFPVGETHTHLERSCMDCGESQESVISQDMLAGFDTQQDVYARYLATDLVEVERHNSQAS